MAIQGRRDEGKPRGDLSPKASLPGKTTPAFGRPREFLRNSQNFSLRSRRYAPQDCAPGLFRMRRPNRRRLCGPARNRLRPGPMSPFRGADEIVQPLNFLAKQRHPRLPAASTLP